MSASIEIKGPPEADEVNWFINHVGPRSKGDIRSVVGTGWRFDRIDFTKPYPHKKWTLTVDDENVLTHYFLTK